MASEAKRSSTGPNKVPIALPKADSVQATNSNLVSQDASLQMAVGSKVRVTTAVPNQNVLEGVVYTADATTGLLVLNVSSSAASTITPSSLVAPSGAYRLIPLSQISSFQILNLPSASDAPKSTPASTTNTLDTNALSKRLDRAVASAQAVQSRQGPKGTSAIDQDVFDALAKTQPARWHGTIMVISEVFMIEKPYNIQNIKLIPGASGDLERMKRVLEFEKKKAILKQPLNVPTAGAGENKTKGG